MNKAVGSTSSTSPAPALSFKKTSGASKNPASAADRKKQIQQLVDMGIAVPDEYRADMALAGDWKVVSQRKVAEPVIDESLNKGVRKRKFEGLEEEEEARETVVRRGWGSTTKRYPGEATNDLNALFSINPLKKEEGIVKKDSEPPLEIDDTTARLAQAAKPDPGSTIDDILIKSDAEDPGIPNLADVPDEPAALIFKKRKQKAR